MKALDLKGKKFNNLTVLEKTKNKGEKVLWKCQCACGKITFVTTCNLRGDKVKSCGCLKNQNLISRNTKHNQRHTKLYEVWKSIKQRCLNPNNRYFKNYGGRGITICKEWKDDFINFYNWSIENGYKENLTIDRIDNNGNYDPSNCRWTNRYIQANNTRNNHYIFFNNENLTISQWAKKLNISYHTLFLRLKNGWSIEKALTTPIKK